MYSDFCGQTVSELWENGSLLWARVKSTNACTARRTVELCCRSGTDNDVIKDDRRIEIDELYLRMRVGRENKQDKCGSKKKGKFSILLESGNLRTVLPGALQGCNAVYICRWKPTLRKKCCLHLHGCRPLS